MHISEAEKFWLFVVIAITIFLIFFNFPFLWNNISTKIGGPKLPDFLSKSFRLGLDLEGGSVLTYKADMSSVRSGEEREALSGLKDLIETRVNVLGVSEPKVSLVESLGEQRLVVELAGIKNIEDAKKFIGETPFLEFKEIRSESEREQILKAFLDKKTFNEVKDMLCDTGEQFFRFLVATGQDPCYKPTGLTGKYLQRAAVNFQGIKAGVTLQFNSEGAKIFEELTGKNVGKPLAIYLDGLPLSTPTVQNKISGGNAEITGNFTIEEAQNLTRKLNQGALPVPIKLIGQTTIGASLGKQALDLIVRAGILGFIFIILFMISYYRFAGVFASLALLMYAMFTLALFKLFVTLTLAGIAGFILSIGMAVDANILIFERTREELRANKNVFLALSQGFERAWPSIRDSNFNTILASASLFFLTSSFVKGFALTLGIGVIVSMFTAITITRFFLKAALPRFEKKIKAFLP